jgi:tRNA U34 2-thiouridine synthase MnmA/TrmU
MTGMDSKNKLNEAYSPDKNSQKEKVVVGLNGGVDSIVTAYLLKIQKFDLIGVTVSNDFPTGQSGFMSCHLDQAKIDKIKDFCHTLGIPHQLVKPIDEFDNDVLEPWINSRITGTNSSPCWSCHELRMKSLYQRMKVMGAKYIATGHYAKIFRHESLGSVFLHTSNDERYDQAPLLSRLPHEILDCLMLPLSDLQKKEVLKLGENFGFTEAERAPSVHNCFKNENLTEFLAKKIPPRFKAGGEIYYNPQDQKIAMHEGAFNYDLGSDFVHEEVKTIQGQVGKYIFKEKKLLVEAPEYFNRHKVLLFDCQIADETPWHDVLKAAVIFPDGSQKECWLQPKALRRAIVEWEGDHRLLEGDILSVSRKTGKNAKVFLTGRVKYLNENVPVQGEENVPKVDHSRDF